MSWTTPQLVPSTSSPGTSPPQLLAAMGWVVIGEHRDTAPGRAASCFPASSPGDCLLATNECLVVSLSEFGGAYVVRLSIKNKEILVFAIRDILLFFFSSGETTALFLSNLIFLSLCQILSYLSASKLYCHHSLLFGLLFIRSFLSGYPLPCVN